MIQPILVESSSSPDLTTYFAVGFLWLIVLWIMLCALGVMIVRKKWKDSE